MAIQPGTRIGVYEVTALIGAGGMGEVYRARDTRLNRDVALKVLPEAFARDMQRMARFEREAKLLASLNHPNIAAIYGIEESGPTKALVMELVEGPTLADRIRSGAIPLDEALPIARQVADAVEYAHDSSVIHRDLKPANIKVKEDGTVKVLDFGLAKAMSDELSESDMSNSPTLSMAATRQGIILGTAAYMSPEQAKGKRVDRRTDVWAFGAVLYEMLTGKPAFQGEDVTDVLASVVKSHPALNVLPPDTPPAVRNLLRRCLEKNLRQRLAHIGEARILIEGVLSGAVTAEPAAAQGARSMSRRAYALGMAGLLLGVAVAGMTAWMLRPGSVTAPISRFDYDLPQNHQFRNAGRTVMAFSPDGSRFVYNTSQGLYLRSMDQLEARLIPGTEEALTNPFFSPDGQWAGYYQLNQLKKIAISGGAPVGLCQATNPFGASWAPDNTILFGQPDGIRRVSADGGTPELIIKSEPGEQFYGPQLLPGGEWVLFSVGSPGAWDEARIVVQSLRSGERREVWRGGSDARYVPTGHIVYALDNDLFAIPFDLDTLAVSGGPVPLVEGVSRAVGGASAAANYGLSNDGALVYITGTATGTQSLVWVDRQGKEEAVPAPPRGYIYPRISPDGTRVALDVRDQENDIVIWDFRRQTLTRFTPTSEAESYPVWTPDGARVAYALGATAAQWKAADGSGVAETIANKLNQPSTYFFSPSGKELVFREVGPSGGPDIGMITIGKEGEPVWLLKSQFVESNAELSPDGRWMAYQSNESGRNEIYVRPFPNVDQGQRQISSGGGFSPLWSRNGRELFYLSGAPVRLMAVSVQTGAAFDLGNPQVLFDWPYLAGGLAGRTYDVSPDGRRFLALKSSSAAGDEAQPSRIIVVQNWTEELKRRVPSGTK